MQVSELVGKVALRLTSTVQGGEAFQFAPVLILSCQDRKAMVCTLSDDGYYDAGVTLCLPSDYYDNSWTEYGSLLHSAISTKAQVIQKMLLVLGIDADEKSLKQLCKAVSYKQLYMEIENQLDLSDMLAAIQSSESISPTAPQGAPRAAQSNAYVGGFVRRGS